MLRDIKTLFVFLFFFLLFFGLVGCGSGPINIHIPMEAESLIGRWEGELTLDKREGGVYETVMELTQASPTCLATISATQTTESEIPGFKDVVLSGEIIDNKLHLTTLRDTRGITFEATYIFLDRKKTILTGKISRHSSETTENRISTDTWQGDLHKWVDPAKQPIVFEDPALEKAVRQAEGYTGEATGSIYPVDVSEITQITIQNKEIFSLEGLEYFINLQRLYANNNVISDLIPIQGLTHLKLVYISANPINDLSALEGLINLESLRFYETQVSDLSPLLHLTQLKTLDFADAQVNDLSAIQALENLTYLNCGYNQISDISPLQMLINLQSIWLINNQIVDIEPLVENEALGEGDYLDIRNNLLDLTEGSEDMQNIERLLNRGVEVFYKSL